MKAVITGASSGIGRDLAKILSGMGYELVLVARRGERLEALRRELPGKAVPVVLDLSRRENCFYLYDLLRDEEIDFFINNAGFGACGWFTELPLETELSLLETNVAAVHILTKLFAQKFAKANHGRILNVASAAGFMAGPLLSAYYASKAYVLRLSEGISEELRQQKSAVRISVLCPGPVKTEFDQVAGVRFSLRGLDSRKVAEYAIRKTLQGKRVIIPGFGMRTALFLARFVPENGVTRAAFHIQHRKLKTK